MVTASMGLHSSALRSSIASGGSIKAMDLLFRYRYS
jgi:hypothetical protein